MTAPLTRASSPIGYITSPIGYITSLEGTGLSYILRNDAYIRSSPATAPRQALVAERPVVLPPEIQGSQRRVTAIPAITAAIPANTAAVR